MDIPNRVSWVNVAVGILAIVSPYVAVPTTPAARWDMTIAGALIAGVAIVNLNAHGRGQTANYWPVFNIVLGIWLFISTTFLAGNIAMIWSNIVLGVLTIVTALVELSYQRLSASHQVQPPTHTHMRT